MQTFKAFKLGMALMMAIALASCASSDTEDMSDSSDMGMESPALALQLAPAPLLPMQQIWVMD